MPGKIPSEFIQELLARVDIVDVINSRVPLTKSGREYKACCPFHNERTPSFFVNPQKQFYHCFGCGESGTAISFLIKYGNLQFREAIEDLASAVGMEVPATQWGRPVSGDFEKLLELMSNVQSAYKTELHRAENSVPRDYLKGRGITRESSLKFGIGYAPDEWDFLLNKFGRNDFERNLLDKAGLITKKDGGGYYDRFRGRIMFPIEDRRGRVIAFGGRVIGSGEPKYLNSPETMLFKKSNELFGLSAALPAIRKAGKVLIVEGYTDVVGLAQGGVEYAVATLGTATTPYHGRELFRTANELVFCFDGDRAGRKAAWRAMESVLPMMYDGRLVSFVFLPQGEDPDSMIREEGKDALEARILSGKPIADFIFDVLENRTDMNRHDGKAKLIEDFKSIFVHMPDSSLRELMLSDLREKTGLSEHFISSRLSQTSTHRGPQRSVPKSTRTGPLDLASKALAVLVQNPSFGWSRTSLSELEVLKDSNVRLLVEVIGLLKEHPNITTAALIENFRESEHFAILQKFAKLEHNVAPGGLQGEFEGMIEKLYQRVADEGRRSLTMKPELTAEELREIQDGLQSRHLSGSRH
ncbi:MAG: DNA primase [Acidiferrobacterales bacterium]|nr:DNA primase [Acidiferrobacterales bacterium]